MRIIDLTLELEDGTATHPAHPRCVVIEFARHAFTAPRFQLPCRGFASRILMFSDHIGTHVDAPFHFFPEKGTIESVPLERLVGPAVWLDFSDKPAERPITPAMLDAACVRAGTTVEPGDILLFRAWPGSHTDDGFLRCAGFNGAAAEWAVAKGIKALGCDLATPDDPSDMARPVHLALLSRDIPIMEHIVHLQTVPVHRFQFVGVPLRIKGATGSPIRAMAIVDRM
jgi:kynurenine formamidase